MRGWYALVLRLEGVISPLADSVAIPRVFG